MLSGYSSSISSGYLTMRRAIETKRLNNSSVLTIVYSAIRSKKTINVTRVKRQFLSGTTKCRCCCFLDNWRSCQQIQSNWKIGTEKLYLTVLLLWKSLAEERNLFMQSATCRSLHPPLAMVVYGQLSSVERTDIVGHYYTLPFDVTSTLHHWTGCAEGDLSLVNLPVRNTILLTSVSCSRTNTHPHQCHEMLSQVSLENDIHGMFSLYSILNTIFSCPQFKANLSTIFKLGKQ